MSCSSADKLGGSPNSMPSLTPTSSLSTNFGSEVSLTLPSSSPPSGPSTTNSNEQSPTLLPSTLQQRPRPRPRPPTYHPEHSVAAVEFEYGALTTLCNTTSIGQTQEGHHGTQGAQKSLREFREQQGKNRKAEEQKLWETELHMREMDERQTDVGAAMLREWLTAGKPRVRVTESMRQRQRDEVAILASRFGVYNGWASNKYGLPGQKSEVSDRAWQASGKPRGWTGW